jgi:hypothetical protein
LASIQDGGIPPELRRGGEQPFDCEIGEANPLRWADTSWVVGKNDVRGADDVWRHVQHIARTHMETGNPIPTLTRRIPNWITGVDENLIHRRSAMPRAAVNPRNQISKDQVTAIWDQITETGSSLDAWTRRPGMVFAFAFALVAQLPGIGHRGGYDLYLKNPELALKSFKGRT